MVLSLSTISEPVGSVKQWIRPDATVPLPTGWLICDGSVVADAASVFNTKTLPDYRSRFARGHSTLTNASFAANLDYFTGGAGHEAGGTDSNNVSHSHGVSNHAHNFSYNLPSHTHSITPDGAHTHPQQGGFGGAFDSLSGSAGTHSHGGATGSGLGFNQNGTTDLSGTSTDSQLGSLDNRPLFRGLIYIVKIK